MSSSAASSSDPQAPPGHLKRPKSVGFSGGGRRIIDVTSTTATTSTATPTTTSATAATAPLTSASSNRGGVTLPATSSIISRSGANNKENKHQNGGAVSSYSSRPTTAATSNATAAHSVTGTPLQSEGMAEVNMANDPAKAALLGMGFKESDVDLALLITKNNLTAATNALLGSAKNLQQMIMNYQKEQAEEREREAKAAAIVYQENVKRFVRNMGDVKLFARMLATEKLISDINVRDKDYFNMTSLMYQVEFGTVESMLYLLNFRPPADTNLRNSSGRTALHYAVKGDHADKAKLLLERGANRSIKDSYGESSLEIAKVLKNSCKVVLETYFPETPAMKLERERVAMLEAKVVQKEKEREEAEKKKRLAQQIAEAERDERDRVANEKLMRERLVADMRAQRRVMKEIEGKERAEAERQARFARDKADRERLAREKEEALRIAKLAKDKVDKERIFVIQEEERLAELKADKERTARLAEEHAARLRRYAEEDLFFSQKLNWANSKSNRSSSSNSSNSSGSGGGGRNNSSRNSNSDSNSNLFFTSGGASSNVDEYVEGDTDRNDISGSKGDGVQTEYLNIIEDSDGHKSNSNNSVNGDSLFDIINDDVDAATTAVDNDANNDDDDDANNEGSIFTEGSIESIESISKTLVIGDAFAARRGCVLIEGHLNRSKVDALNTSKWQVRYFVLFEDTLKHYKSEADYRNNKAPKSILYFGKKNPSTRIISGGPDPIYVEGGRNIEWYSIVLNLPDQVFTIASRLRSERDQWLSCMHRGYQRGRLTLDGALLYFTLEKGSTDFTSDREDGSLKEEEEEEGDEEGEGETSTWSAPEKILLNGWSTIDGSISYRATSSDYFPFDPHGSSSSSSNSSLPPSLGTTAAATHVTYDLLCHHEDEANEWVAKIRTVRNGTKLPYLSTLVKVEVNSDTYAKSRLFQCRMLFGLGYDEDDNYDQASTGASKNASNVAAVRKEWRLSLRYDDLRSIYKSLDEHGLLTGGPASLYWEGYEFPSSRMVKSDVYYQDSMWLFLERVLKTYPYPPEVRNILKLDSELLPYLDAANQVTNNGLRFVAEQLAIKNQEVLRKILELLQEDSVDSAVSIDNNNNNEIEVEGSNNNGDYKKTSVVTFADNAEDNVIYFDDNAAVEEGQYQDRFYRGVGGDEESGIHEVGGRSRGLREDGGEGDNDNDNNDDGDTSANDGGGRLDKSAGVMRGERRPDGRGGKMGAAVMPLLVPEKDGKKSFDEDDYNYDYSYHEADGGGEGGYAKDVDFEDLVKYGYTDVGSDMGIIDIGIDVGIETTTRASIRVGGKGDGDDLSNINSSDDKLDPDSALYDVDVDVEQVGKVNEEGGGETGEDEYDTQGLYDVDVGGDIVDAVYSPDSNNAAALYDVDV